LKDLVSVITPFFNEEKYIKDSITSILSQTYENIELILINDNSTDTSLEICKSFNDSRISVFTKEDKIRGEASSRNLAIDLAKGNFIATQDADDISHPERIEKQLIKAQENPTKLIIGTWLKKVDKKETLIKLPIENQDIIKGFKRNYKRVTFVAGTLFCSSEILKNNHYREKFKYMTDWDLLLRLFEKDKYIFFNIPEYLYTYYVRDKGTKCQPDWTEYNYFARNCQKRRLKGKNEFENNEEFKKYLSSNKYRKLKWTIFNYLLKIKLKIIG